MDRRSFLRRGSIALAGGLVVGDAALEMFERLAHRKVFALGALPETASSIVERTQAYAMLMNKRMEVVTQKISNDMYLMGRQWITKYPEHALIGIVEIRGEMAHTFTPA